METKRICPSCQKTLPANVPLGLCPECLIKSGFNTETEPGNPGKASGFVPPPVEQIRKLFPHLEIVELVGKGGMGAVYKARQTALDRLVALKILPPGAAGDAGFAERFNREARALARLNHPHIVAVHDFGQAGGQPYLVMEFVDGPNLRQVEQAGRLTPAQALEIIPQICEALQFAHNEGVVHRDIKPENILLDKKGRVKITDFGIAKIVGVPSGKGSLTGAKDVLGTPHYMAPEQVEHPQAVDHRADIYSLGVVFYELLTGELPLGKFQPPSKKVQVDVRLDEVVLHTLEKEPERRYQHVSEVKTDVENIAHTPSPPPTANDGLAMTRQTRVLQLKSFYLFIAAACFLGAAVMLALGGSGIASILSLVGVMGFSIAGYRHLRAAQKLGDPRGSNPPAVAGTAAGKTPQVQSGLLGRNLMPEDTAARWAQWVSFGAALVILVLGFHELPKFDLRPHELFFGILLVLILALVMVVAGYHLVGAAGTNRVRQELVPWPGAPAPGVQEGALAKARQEVKAPASWLVVTGILNWIAIPLMVLVVGAIQEDSTRRTLLPLMPLAAFVLSGVMIAAGLKMKRLEAHSLAVIGSLLAILVTPGNIIGLPIGIWSLIVLCRRDVREAFGRGRSPLAAKPPPPARSSGSWRAMAVAVVSHAVLLLAVAAFFDTAVPRIYEEFNDFAFALPTGTVQTFILAQFIRNHVFILVPLALALDVALCWLVQRVGGRRLLGLWAVIVSLGLIALLLSSLWLLNLPLQKLPTALWERNERVLAVLQSNSVQEEVQRRLRAANLEFTSPNIHLQPEHNRAIWYFDSLKELKPVGETNVWTPIQGTLTQRVLPDGSWQVQGEGDLKHIRFSAGATSSPPAGNGLTFSPVTMAALSDANPATDRSLIDLDNGKTFTPPPRMSLSDPWLAQNGIDVVVANQAGLQGLVALKMSVVQASPEEWDTVAAAAVSKRIGLGRPPAEQVLSGKGALPATYLFKTREGGMGVLQITRVSDNPRGVKVRYKLVTGASDKTKPSLEKTDSKPATLGPEIEFVLKTQEVRPEGRVAELLDLDTGQRATSTNFGDNDRETHAWVRTNHLDVIGVIERGQIAVLCFDTVVMPAVSKDWETVTAHNLVTNWNLAQNEPNKITGISPMTDKTDTWLFRTREGGRGLLQILGQNSNPPGVKVRYKLVQAP